MLATAQQNVIYRGKIFLAGEKLEIDSADKNLKFFKGQKAPPITTPEVEEKLPPLGKQK
ncbi:MAG: hypothetical protein IJK81_00400 [Selenomonadaceae bacterium]|nr:hypothetical protein [Selenomonadaceae bacterium]